MSLPGVPADRCNMPGMTGRTFHSAVVQGLFVCLCLCEPLHAWQNSQTCEPQLSQTEEQDLETLRSAAEQGDAEAQFNLGLMYEQGQGITQDYAEALRWYRLAAGPRDTPPRSPSSGRCTTRAQAPPRTTPRPFGGTASRPGRDTLPRRATSG